MIGTRPKGAVAAGHRLTAEAAAAVLRDGGHAADAAIAALAMACVCEPVLASPGGGGFAMVLDGSSGALSLIDFFPHTPQDKRQKGDGGVREVIADFGSATQAFHIGPATVAAPGFFAGIEKLRLHNRLAGLGELFAPAVAAAREGVVVTAYQHYLATVVKPIMVATPDAAKLFAPGGDVPGPGAIFNNPGLADALESLAKDGFSRGPVGDALANMQTDSGHLTGADLAAYEAIDREPFQVSVAGAKVHLNPPPAASGVLIGHSLVHLTDVSPAGFATALGATDTARRAAGGDLSQLVTAPLRQRGTTHISVVDRNGNAVAVTVSNGEGNGEIVGDFGFMPNNILGEEDVNPFGMQDWPVNARLASMMCPAMIEMQDGELIVLGSGGSNRIRSAIFQVIARCCHMGTGLEEAIAAPRMHVENGHLDFEDLFAGADTEKLKRAFSDHRAWPEPNMFFGGVHAVRMDRDGRFTGVGDLRRDGVAVVVT